MRPREGTNKLTIEMKCKKNENENKELQTIIVKITMLIQHRKDPSI